MADKIDHGHHDHGDAATKAFFDHSSAPRVATDAVLARTLTAQYPGLELVIVPESTCALIPYALAGNATLTPVEGEDKNRPSSLSWEVYRPPAKRIDGNRGGLGERVLFGKFLYRWQGTEFLLYLADGRDGTQSYPVNSNYYILTPPENRAKADSLVLAAGFWGNELREEVWVFDGGYWQKSAELYNSIRHASWENVILDPAMKKALIDDHLDFFRSRETYAKLQVPWKRGIIYYGPPGNGKTISIKAMMHTLYGLDDPIPTLYVRSLTSYGGPEYSVKQIFAKARQFAPCYLVFEDLDSIVTDFVRSYFLNEVDGLKANDGIFMIGSTNHLERLDPGISKRPSRFDRKYLFPNPNLEERTAYCHFWQHKLADNKDIEFPDELCKAIAGITDKFSFAYMQEAFMAALLVIARRADSDCLEDDWVGVTCPDHVDQDGASIRSDRSDAIIGLDGDDDDDDDDEDLDRLILWVEIKKQIKILREGLDDKRRSSLAAPSSLP